MTLCWLLQCWLLLCLCCSPALADLPYYDMSASGIRARAQAMAAEERAARQSAQARQQFKARQLRKPISDLVLYTASVVGECAPCMTDLLPCASCFSSSLASASGLAFITAPAALLSCASCMGVTKSLACSSCVSTIFSKLRRLRDADEL